MKHVTLLLLAMVVLAPALASSVPNRLHVQGKLANLAGEPADGLYALTFVLYAEPEAVTKVHEETFPGVKISDGVFSQILGAKVPLDPELFDENEGLWLLVQVDGAPVGAPMPVLSVAFAFKASIADVAHEALGLEASPTAPAPCGPATLGRAYMNTADGRVHYCTGAGWEVYMGPKGETGAAGAQGPQGDKGDTGAAGAQGPQGDTGAAGAQGPKGDKGDTGAAGAQGPKGDKGDTGAAGAQGPKGDKGDTGATGAQGPKGDKGDTGATGAQGPKGDKGDTGAAGAVGPQGPKGDSGGLCYTRWGEWGCAAGYTEVMQGQPGGLESFHSGGTTFGHVECLSASAPVMGTWISGYHNRLMRGDAQGDGMQKVRSRCSVCCSGGCFLALGTSTCPSGYTRVYYGRAGGVEAYNGGQIHGQTLCIDGGADVHHTWPSGYSTRLMRHRDIGGNTENGMDQIDNLCAMCCKIM